MFDLSNVKENNRETIPAGKYVMSVTNAEMKETKTGGGQYINAEMTIQQGEYKGRKLFTRFNVVNQNQKATEIGLQQLKSLLVNGGYPTPDKLASVTDICGLIVGVKTKIKSDEEYGDRSEVSYFFDPKKAAPAKSEENIPF